MIEGNTFTLPKSDNDLLSLFWTVNLDKVAFGDYKTTEIEEFLAVIDTGTPFIYLR